MRELLAQHTPRPEGAEKTKLILRAALQWGRAPPWHAFPHHGPKSSQPLSCCVMELAMKAQHRKASPRAPQQRVTPQTLQLPPNTIMFPAQAATKHHRVPCPAASTAAPQASSGKGAEGRGQVFPKHSPNTNHTFLGTQPHHVFSFPFRP